MREGLVARVEAGKGLAGVIGSCAVVILVGGAAFGAAFGAWRSIEQAIYSAVKMPALLFAVAILSGAANAMLAQALGVRLSFRQVLTCMLMAFAIASALLGSISPWVAFLILQAPGGGHPDAVISYRFLLPVLTALIGCAGLAGTGKLMQLLQHLAGSRAAALRLLACWIFVSGLAGCELSWLFSPFLARPDLPVPFLNPNAFRSNFFEYIWRTVQGML
jgi:hypothetical protein